MNILYLINTLERGGAELLLAKITTNLDHKKYTPMVGHLYPPNNFMDLFKQKKIKVYDLHLKNRYDFLKGFHSLRKIIIKEKIDLLHTHLYDANILGRLAAKSVGLKKIITTLHNPDYSFEDNGKFSFKLRKFLDKKTGQWNTDFTAVSQAVKSDYESHLGFRNIKIIHNGIDPKEFESFNALDPKEAKLSLGFKPHQFIFLNIARLHVQKGQITLIHAFQAIQQKYPHALLLMVGDGPEKESLQRLAGNLNLLNKNIFFLEKQNSVGALLKASDVFILPSLYEGFGISSIEAMYLKVPVIASDTGGLKEIIENQKEGILVPPAESAPLIQSMECLIENPTLRYHMALNGHKKVLSKFLIQHTIEKLDKVYQG